MTKRIISAYTPSNTDAETRERIFVQRHKLLARVVRWCEESMLTGNKHHLLFIGPRGCGKTHLVSMAQERLATNLKLDDKMRVAWLGEDNVFTGLIDVALEIADELAKEYPNEFDFDFRAHAKSLSGDEAAESILEKVIELLGDKSILLIMENLDRAFHGLGEGGQKKWRAFLQETGRIATLATSQQLFEDISSRDAAFFGFFEIIHLEPLSVDDALQLMANIARENENTNLLQFLNTSEGRYRVRALHHLAGGNHRMYVMVSEFLTRESLDGLVTAFEQLAEELTPYFQERVRSLSPQQGRIVQSLCNASGAMSVKEVAEDTFISERNVSKQLGELKQKGYVVSEKRGKESYYEMAEPLMRLCLEVKKQRGKPLKLVASFLRAWYSAKALRSALDFPAHAADENSHVTAYKRVALESDDIVQRLIEQSLNREFESRIRGGDFVHAMRLAEELEFSDERAGLICKSRVFKEEGSLSEALQELNKLLLLPALAPAQKAEALRTRGTTYSEFGEAEKAITDYSAVINMSDVPVDEKAMALFNRGVRYGKLNRTEKEIADYSAVIDLADADVNLKAKALVNRCVVYGQLREYEKTLADCNAVIEMEETAVEPKIRALVSRGVTYGRLGQPEKEMADYSAVIGMEDVPTHERSTALLNRGVARVQLGEYEKAIADYSAVIAMANASDEHKADAVFARGLAHDQLGDSVKAIDDYSALIEMTEASIDQRVTALVNRGVIYRELGEYEKAIADYSDVIVMTEAPVRQRALAFLNRGFTYTRLGKFGNSIADYTAVIEMKDASVHLVAQAINELGFTYWDSNEFALALNQFSSVVKMTNVSAAKRTNALFAIPAAMIPIKSVNESIASIEHAFQEGDPKVREYGGSPKYILKAILGREQSSWPEFIEKLVPIYANYQALNLLGSAITEVIVALDEGGYSESQVDLWNSAWQKFRGEFDELSISLDALDAAVQVIKTGKDRPLFDLPLEIRKIVRPLLKNSLSEN